jgi:hypothetical protein
VSVEFRAESHPDSNGQPLPERTGRRLEDGEHPAVRVTLERAAELPKRIETIGGTETRLGERGIEGRCGVSFAQDKSIPFGPVGLFGPMAHLVEEKDCQDVRRRQGSSWVAGCGGSDHPDDVFPDGSGHFLQLDNDWIH